MVRRGRSVREIGVEDATHQMHTSHYIVQMMGVAIFGDEGDLLPVRHILHQGTFY